MANDLQLARRIRGHTDPINMWLTCGVKFVIVKDKSVETVAASTTELWLTFHLMIGNCQYDFLSEMCFVQLLLSIVREWQWSLNWML
jgi:hypothetical protein